MPKQNYIIKSKEFTKKFPNWELVKIGMCYRESNVEGRIVDILKGLNRIDWEYELANSEISEEELRLRETYYKSNMIIRAFERVVGKGIGYRPNIALKLINPMMYRFLEEITKMKSGIRINWGVTEWVVRPKTDWVEKTEQMYGVADRGLLSIQII